MNAKELYLKLSETYVNNYFGSYEELNMILDNADYPCLVVIPVLKRISFVTDRFRIVETVVIASLDKMEIDLTMDEIYDSIKVLEENLLKELYPFEKNIQNYQVLSELNKFDANVLFAAFSLDLINKPLSC